MPPAYGNRETRRNRTNQIGKQHAVTPESARIHKRDGPSYASSSRGGPSPGRENINSEAQSEFVSPTRLYLRRGGPHGHELVIESPFRWTDLSVADLKCKSDLDCDRYASYFPGGVHFFEPGKVDQERSRLKAAGQNQIIYDYIYEVPRKRTLEESKKHMENETGRLVGDERVEYIHSRRPSADYECEIVVTLRDAATELQGWYNPLDSNNSSAHISVLRKLFFSKGQELRELGVDWPWDESPRSMFIQRSSEFALISTAINQTLLMYLGPSYLVEGSKNENDNSSNNDACRNHDHVSRNYDDNDRNADPPGVDFYFYSAYTWDEAWNQAKKHRRISTIEFGNEFDIEDKHLYAIASAQNCIELRKLKFGNDDTGYGKRISDDAMHTFAQACPSLREVCFISALSLSDDSVLALAFCCPQIERIAISGSARSSTLGEITGRCFRRLILCPALASKLRRLDLVHQGVENNTAGLKKFSRARPELTIGLGDTVRDTHTWLTGASLADIGGSTAYRDGRLVIEWEIADDYNAEGMIDDTDIADIGETE